MTQSWGGWTITGENASNPGIGSSERSQPVLLAVFRPPKKERPEIPKPTAMCGRRARIGGPSARVCWIRSIVNLKPKNDVKEVPSKLLLPLVQLMTGPTVEGHASGRGVAAG